MNALLSDIKKFASDQAFPLVLILIGLIALISNITVSVPHHPQPNVIVDVLDPSLEQYAPAWRTEVSRRFPTDTVAVLCHGGSVIKGSWIVYNHPGSNYAFESIQDLIHEEQIRYPSRRIILLCCNPSHETLHGFPNVFYSAGSTWCIPDRAMTLENSGNATDKLDSEWDLIPAMPTRIPTRWEQDDSASGNIWEFINAD